MISPDADRFLQESLDRSKYCASEMPQGFVFDIILTAYQKVGIFLNIVDCFITVAPVPKQFEVNPIALRMAKTLWSFGCSECSRVKLN